jgi:threonine/homoserine/homoserine lactone efflux protein
MILSLLRGLILGFVCGIPVGPVNAAVIDTAFRKCFRRAFAIGLGGAFVDFVYSQIAMAGLGTILNRAPRFSTVLMLIGGVVLFVYGVITIKAPPPPAHSGDAKQVVLKRALAAAFLTGVLTTVMNPAAIVSWVLLAGTALNGLTGWHALVAGTGIFFGTAFWFLGIAWLASKGRVKLGSNAIWVTRAVGALLIVYGVFLVAKTSYVVWAASIH